MPTSSPSPIHSFVSKLPWNSSIADENSLQVSIPPNATATVSSENITWSSVNDTMKAPDNSSITVNNLPSGPNTTPVTSVMETDGWHTTTRDSLAELTPYQETTLQPTLKFTNKSKIFPNTEDPQEGKYKWIKLSFCVKLNLQVKSLHLRNVSCWENGGDSNSTGGSPFGGRP